MGGKHFPTYPGIPPVHEGERFVSPPAEMAAFSRESHPIKLQKERLNIVQSNPVTSFHIGFGRQATFLLDG